MVKWTYVERPFYCAVAGDLEDGAVVARRDEQTSV